ncbi:MAG: hypothetical protein Ct9H300mP4_02630 [Gammaproteobacteria bacterium]|nr:MAG: hypothetical protein Ct9H300mP4_02630 [Gammaproteobacteria bacterium]
MNSHQMMIEGSAGLLLQVFKTTAKFKNKKVLIVFVVPISAVKIKGRLSLNGVMVLDWDQISDLLEYIDVYEPIKKVFIEYSLGHAEIPPVGELLFANPPGRCISNMVIFKEVLIMS